MSETSKVERRISSSRLGCSEIEKFIPIFFVSVYHYSACHTALCHFLVKRIYFTSYCQSVASCAM